MAPAGMCGAVARGRGRIQQRAPAYTAVRSAGSCEGEPHAVEAEGMVVAAHMI